MDFRFQNLGPCVGNFIYLGFVEKNPSCFRDCRKHACVPMQNPFSTKDACCLHCHLSFQWKKPLILFHLVLVWIESDTFIDLTARIWGRGECKPMGATKRFLWLAVSLSACLWPTTSVYLPDGKGTRKDVLPPVSIGPVKWLRKTGPAGKASAWWLCESKFGRTFLICINVVHLQQHWFFISFNNIFACTECGRQEETEMVRGAWSGIRNMFPGINFVCINFAFDLWLWCGMSLA